MSDALVLAPTSSPNIFLAPDGSKRTAPAGWACLPPGDAGLTRRVKALGPSWSIIEKRGRKAFSKGLWAPRENIEAARAALAQERSTPGYAKKRATATARRAHEQAVYVVSFETEVLQFLRFSPRFEAMARAIARLVTAHATRQRHRRSHRAHPHRTPRRVRRHRLDAPPNDRLRLDEHPARRRQTSRSPPRARHHLPRHSRLASPRHRAHPERLPALPSRRALA
jgi:hypothetical protein